MIEQLARPKLPSDVAGLYLDDGRAQEVYMRWRSNGLKGLDLDSDLKSYTDPASGEGIRYGEYVPAGDIDEEHLLNIRFPFGNGNKPHMRLRVRLIAELLDVPQRVRFFPDDALGERTLDVKDSTIEAMRNGNFRRIGELQQSSAESDPNLRSVKANDNSGASFGGVIAIEQSAIAPTRSVDFIEIPTLVDRTQDPKSLDRDIMNGNGVLHLLEPYNQAMLDSGIPALAEAFGVNEVRATLRQLVGGALFGIGTNSKVNKAKKAGMTHRISMQGLFRAHELNPGLAIVMGHGAGNVMPELESRAAELAMRTLGHRVLRFSLGSYAHEAADNIWIPALLSREARSLAVERPEAA